MRILIINPNSSESVTRAMETLVPDPTVGLDYVTGPPDAPASINNDAEDEQSAVACMRMFEADPGKYLGYDGYLVCCFSDHPLIYKLRKACKDAVVMGIFQCSVLYALGMVGDEKAVILSSGKTKPQRDASIWKLVGSDHSSSFLPSLGCGVGVLELTKPENYPIIKDKIDQLQKQGAAYILLGCAGFSGLSGKLYEDFPGIRFVDTTKCGIETICAYVRMGK